MSKHLLVDGFNLIRRDRELSGVEQRNFYGAQQLLLERLAVYRRGTSHRVTVIFDGHGGPNPHRSRSHHNGVDIVYSAHGETADDVIKDLVSRPGTPGGLLVATADRDLAHSCRTHGVPVIAPGELMARSRPKIRPPAGDEFWQGKQEETGWAGHTRKKGNPSRKPKTQRRPSGLW